MDFICRSTNSSRYRVSILAPSSVPLPNRSFCSYWNVARAFVDLWFFRNPVFAYKNRCVRIFFFWRLNCFSFWLWGSEWVGRYLQLFLQKIIENYCQGLANNKPKKLRYLCWVSCMQSDFDKTPVPPFCRKRARKSRPHRWVHRELNVLNTSFTFICWKGPRLVRWFELCFFLGTEFF